jgi:uncharacterized membrane protein
VRREDALRDIKAAARSRQLVFTQHAYEKMDALGETEASVGLAICDASSIASQADGSWRVFGGGLTCVVVISGDVIVVTLFV